MKVIKSISVILFLLSITSAAFAQIDSDRIQEMTREEILQISQDDLLEMSMENLMFLSQKLGISIDELLNMKTGVASSRAFSPRETPGIVSIITEEEIRYSGARDLIDALRLVPGFDFGYDVQGVVGIGLRGNWVHEGKLLLLVDGQQMNEISYYNIPFGNHFPVDQISKIEVIRGPGSAIYGGNAELGVINIITKTGQDLKGVEISGTYGQFQESMGRANLNMNTGFSAKGWDVTAKGFIGDANRSDQPFIEYIDDPENVIDLSEGGSEIKSRQINLGANNKNLSVRLMYDDYKTWYNHYADSATGNEGIYNEFQSIMGEIKYNLKASDKLSFVPRFIYKYNRPYYEEGYWRNFQNNRYAGNLIMNYLVTKGATLVAGIEYYGDRGHCINDTGYFYYNNTRDLHIRNFSVFAEGTVRLGKINIVAGIRSENNSEFGWASAPRLGATGVFNKFHFKALFSGAFRSPGIGNIDVASEIKPEKSFVTELEMGYRINDYMFLTANVFDVKISNSIIYFDNGGWTPGVDWGYKNADNAGSDGFELEFKAMHAKGFATVNYSFYTQAYRPVPESYSVPGHKNSALALPQHKIGVNLNYMPVKNIHIGPSLVYIGKKYGYVGVDEEYNATVGELGPDYLVNLTLTYDNLFRNGFSLALSAFDLLNQKPVFIQPYNGWFYPYPGCSREILVKLILTSDLIRKK
jgi:outer membrane receptor for ferrienterochelin and colicin